MSPAALDNANPTVLNASELPTRKHKVVPRRGPDSKYTDIIFAPPSYLSTPFCGDDNGATIAWPRGGSGGADDGFSDDATPEPIDEQEIYDLISTITDPEHPVSLGQLSVINLADIRLTPSPSSSHTAVSDYNNRNSDTLIDVFVEITPTITHCSLATILGLAVRVRLEQALPPNYRVDVRCKESSHVQDDQVNKQLADKERVAAALENDSLRGVLDKMLEMCY
ncbi:FAM96B-like protein [Beauveria brongniartii RCEF 3172]|uniref:FAM96B-like protein n=1 Tax=Beauveria brongniartii RCEF 3172 TaxID=1081107 RepID=A0A166RYG8_9HYPO|nr:FAM96B-like protein [Beauveria brongniartii RCEF 3172]